MSGAPGEAAVQQTDVGSYFEQYLDLLAREWVLYAEAAAVRGRGFDFVYFGGGTPSFLSTKQVQGLGSQWSCSTSLARCG